jgi:hypothetical protein
VGGRSACWSLLALVACTLTACGGGQRAVSVPTAPVPGTTPDTGIERLVAAVPRADDLPDRLLVEGGVLATSDLTVVNALGGRIGQLYALVPAGPVVNQPLDPPSCTRDIAPEDGTEATRRVNAASQANFDACTGRLGCGPVEIASIEGASRQTAQENAEKLSVLEACAAQLTGFTGPPVDGRFLLQPGPASASAALPVAVVVYPSGAAFAASVKAVAGSSSFRAAPGLGRFDPSALPGCGLQFYPATASALVWCDDASGRHDPGHDATVAALGKVLGTPGTGTGERAVVQGVDGLAVP